MIRLDTSPAGPSTDANFTVTWIKGASCTLSGTRVSDSSTLSKSKPPFTLGPDGTLPYSWGADWHITDAKVMVVANCTAEGHTVSSDPVSVTWPA